MDNYNYGNMESSMSVSSLSFEEDEFDKSDSEDEIRLVDIEKEIMSKKGDESRNISVISTFGKEESEKENVHQKMLNITKFGLTPNRPSQKKVFAIKSQGRKLISDAVKATAPPVKHFAYRTAQKPKPQSTSSSITTPGKVKYVAIRSNTSYDKCDSEQSYTIESLDQLASSNKLSLSQSSKADAKNAENVSSSAMDIDHDESSPSLNSESDNPNFNNIEIIDECESEAEPYADRADIEVIEDKHEEAEATSTKEASNQPSTTLSSPLSKSKFLSEPQGDSKSEVISAVPGSTKSSYKITVFRSIAPKPTAVDTVASQPTSLLKSAQAKQATQSVLLPPSVETNETVQGTEVNMSGKNVIMHSGSSILPQPNLIPGGSTTQSLNFIVPKDDIIKCKLNNTPLVLSVPPLLTTDGSHVAPVGRNLLMILPQQLPSNLQRSGVVNFIVSNPYFKPNVSVQIPPSPKNAPLILRNSTNTLINKPATGKPTSLQKSQATSSTDEVKILNTKEKDGPSWCWYAPKFGKRDLEGFLFKDRLGFSRTETDRVKKCLRKLNIAIYKKQLELDDIASNIIRIKRGLKPIVQTPAVEIPRQRGPVPKHTPTSKFSPHGNKRYPHKGFKKTEQEKISDVADGTNQIKIVSVASLSELNENSSLGFENQTESSTVPLDTHSGDDGSSDLYYTKKVVILRNRNPNSYLHRRKTKRIGRLPKIKLKQNKTPNSQSSQKLKTTKPTFPSVKKCSVVLHRDEKLEEEIRKKFDLKDRSRRKRKLDLESMGLIKKVRRRNAIDTPLTTENLKAKSRIDTKSLKIKPRSTISGESKMKQDTPATTKTSLKISSELSRLERTAEVLSKAESKSLDREANSKTASPNKDELNHDDLGSSSSGSLKMTLEKQSDLPLGQQKSGYKKDTGYKKGVFMSYRERQKISALTHTERTFIFALNTIHALEDLRLDDQKPLLILDQFNIRCDNNSSSLNFTFKFDCESMNNYNVVFTRDDDEPLPLLLLKNLKLVYLVRHGHIKVVSRPVLCKYLLEKCNLVKKPIKEIQIELQSNSADSNRIRTENVKSKRGKPRSVRPDTVHTRHDVMQPKHKHISPSTSHSVQKTGSKQKALSKSKPSVKSSPKHRTDSLETKFNEIEKNLSMMFEKTKPLISDISNVMEMSNIDELNSVPQSTQFSKTIIASHSKDSNADLDYLFANSGDENSNLDKVMKDKTDNMLSQGKEPVLSEQQLLVTSQPTEQQGSKLSKQITAIVEEKGKGANTTENLEEILISDNESEVKIMDHTKEVEKAKEEVMTQSPEKPNVHYSEYSIDEDTQLRENTISLPSTTMDVLNEDDDDSKSTSKLVENTGSNSEPATQTVTAATLLSSQTLVLGNTSAVQSENTDHDISECIQHPVEDGSKCKKENEDILASIDSDVITPDQNVTEKCEEFSNLNENANWGESIGDKFKELDIDQFLSSQNKKCSKPSAVDRSGIKKEQIENFSEMSKEHTSEKDVCYLDTSDNDEILGIKEKDVHSKIEVTKTDISSSTSNIAEIFKETASEQQNVLLDADSIIPPEESLVYLMPDKSGDIANTPTETSSDVSMSTLQVTPNMADVEDNTSKISYTETSFGSNVVLNDQVTVNIMHNSNEFELFNNTSDKVADDSASIASSSLGFGDGAPDPDSNMIILDTRKPTDTDLLSPCEIDTDIAMCSDGISKNLPDDYLEK